LIEGNPVHTPSIVHGTMSAILNTSGLMLMGIAVVIGYAGPANALGSC